MGNTLNRGKKKDTARSKHEIQAIDTIDEIEISEFKEDLTTTNVPDNPLLTVCSFAELVDSDDNTATLYTGHDNGEIFAFRHKQSTNTWSPIGSTKPHTRSIAAMCPVSYADLKSAVFSGSRDCSLTLNSFAIDTCNSLYSVTHAHDMTISAVAQQTEYSGVSESIVASGSRDTVVKLWDLSVESQEATAQCQQARNVVTCMKFVGNTLFQGSEDLQIRMWDTRQKDMLNLSGSITDFTYFPLCIELPPGSQPTQFVTGSKGFNGAGCEVRLWDVRERKQISAMCGHEHDVIGCGFISDLVIVSASKDGVVKVWDALQQTCIASLRVVPHGGGQLTGLTTALGVQRQFVDGPPGTWHMVVVGSFSGDVIGLWVHYQGLEIRHDNQK